MTVVWAETKHHCFIILEDGEKTIWGGEITDNGMKKIVDVLDKAFGVLKQKWDGAELTLTFEDDVIYADIEPILIDLAEKIEIKRL